MTHAPAAPPAPPSRRHARRFLPAFVALAASVALKILTAALSMADTCDGGLMFGVFALSMAATLGGGVLALIALVRGPQNALAWVLALAVWGIGLVLLAVDVGVFTASAMACAAPR